MIDYLKYCSRCSGVAHCCSNPDEEGFVTVGIKDAERIKKATALEFADFLDYTKLKPSTIAECKNDESGSEGRLRFHMLSDGRILRMKMRRDEKCKFLSGKNTCTIYACRPLICRMYPFWYKRTKKNQIKIIPHETESKCLLLETALLARMSEKDLKTFTEMAVDIEKEAAYYRENIQDFVRRNKLV